MRILHVHSGNLYGGVETVLTTIAGRQHPELQSGFALTSDARLSSELREMGASVHSLPAVRIRRPDSIVRARGHLRRVLQTGSYEVVLCHSPWSLAIFAPAARRLGLPVAMYLHDEVRGVHWLERWAKKHPPDLVLCNSQFTRSSVQGLFPDVPSAVVHCPVEPGFPAIARESRTAIRSAMGANDDTVVIIQVSRLEPWKGHRLHFDALGLLRERRDWVCWMVGGPQRPFEADYLADLRRQVADLGIADRVRFLGQRNDVRELLAAADIHCQPNTGPEPFGITFIEALYSGLPVVTTSIGAAPEIIDASCGVLVPPAAEALGAALWRLIGDSTLREALGARGPARARELSDPDERCRQLGSLLSEVRPNSSMGRTLWGRLKEGRMRAT